MSDESIADFQTEPSPSASLVYRAGGERALTLRETGAIACVLYDPVEEGVLTRGALEDQKG